ncbi:hypothetical protein HYR54_12270 [Candidatus Acetothermia bacterium]|nr:hypothetical protein [Candidatus Acetothermia bacterium]
MDLRKIAQLLEISEEHLLEDGTLAFLEKEKRLTEEDLADFRERYGVLSRAELEKKIKEGLTPPHPAWEDLIQWENLEAYRAKLDSLLREFHASRV